MCRIDLQNRQKYGRNCIFLSMSPALLLLLCLFLFAPESSSMDIDENDSKPHATPTVSFIFNSRASKQETSQYASGFSYVVPEVEEATGLKINFEVYNGENNFIEMALEQKYDFIYPYREADFVKLMRSGQYDALLNFSIYGIENNIFCIYAKDEEKQLKELEGLRMQIGDDLMAYIALRKELGENPERFFVLSRAQDAASAFYALAFDKVDAIFTTMARHSYLELTNPGVIKGLKESHCVDLGPNPALLISKNTPGKFGYRIMKVMTEFRKRGLFKQFRSILDQINVEFRKVENDQYMLLIALLEEAEEKGWDTDYEKWNKYQEN